jgi:ribosomal 50S subunit-recycling heat shock protein
MRLDKWLKISRVIKRRPVANDICDQGRVSLNGRPAKAAADIKVGDQMEIRFGQRLLSLEVLQVPTGNVSTKMAPDLYRVIAETRLKDEEAALGGDDDAEEEDD